MNFGLCTETRHSHVRRIKGKPPIPIKCSRNPNGHVFGGKPIKLDLDFRAFPMYACIMCGEAVVVMFPCIRDGKRQ
jgi:hypothetical protein